MMMSSDVGNEALSRHRREVGRTRYHVGARRRCRDVQPSFYSSRQWLFTCLTMDQSPWRSNGLTLGRISWNLAANS